MSIIKSFTITLLNGQNKILKMDINVPTKKDAEYCANALRSDVEAIVKLNNRLCGWTHHKVSLKIVIEDHKA